MFLEAAWTPAAPCWLESFALELVCWIIQMCHGLNFKFHGASTISCFNFVPQPITNPPEQNSATQGLNFARTGEMLHWEQRCIAGTDRRQHIPIGISLCHRISKKFHLSRLMGTGPVRAFQPPRGCSRSESPDGLNRLLQPLEPYIPGTLAGLNSL